MIVLHVLIVCYLFPSLAASSPAVLPRGVASNNPSAANFLHRAFHATVVLGNFLYIDGGEFSQLLDGPPEEGVPSLSNDPTYSRQNNFALSIDLRSSWTNTSVVINLLPKGSAPVLNCEVLWGTPDGKSCYVWGGELSFLNTRVPPPPVDLWQFTSNSTGGGVWSQQSVTNATFSKAQRQAIGSGISMGDTGFYVRGFVSSSSDPSVQGDQFTPVTGVLSFNYTSGAWSSDSSVGLRNYGTIIGAAAVTIPAFGLDDRGLLVIIGGKDPLEDRSDWESTSNSELISFSNITIYDPYIGAWFAHHAVGDIPAPWQMFYAVSILGDNGTYEIFVYGGINTENWQTYDDDHVLTIPGFVWFKASYTPAAPRFGHTCEIVGGRQLMIVGGLDNKQSGINFYSDWQMPDPFSQGIGIFDMMTMTWKSSYEPNTSIYKSPNIVKEWYPMGNQDSVQWQSKELARMFIRDKPFSVSPTPAATAPATSTATASTGLSESDKIGLGVGIGFGVPSFMSGLITLWFKFKKQKSSKNDKSQAGDSAPRTPDGLTTADAQSCAANSNNPLPAVIVCLLRKNELPGVQPLLPRSRFSKRTSHSR